MSVPTREEWEAALPDRKADQAKVDDLVTYLETLTRVAKRGLVTSQELRQQMIAVAIEESA